MVSEANADYSGVLCRRATWKDGIPIFAQQRPEAFRRLARRRTHQEHQRRACCDLRGQVLWQEAGHRLVFTVSR